LLTARGLDGQPAAGGPPSTPTRNGKSREIEIARIAGEPVEAEAQGPGRA
jgi:hypothetical protein